MKILDSGFRRNDEKKAFGTFYEIINVGTVELEWRRAMLNR
jgi:hypothetical protein